MRKIFLLAAIAVLGFSSCKKDENQPHQDQIQLTLITEIATPATKATYTYDEGIKMAWEAEERITIVTFKDGKAVSAQNLSSTGEAGRKTATFSGSFTPTEGATYIACYPPLVERGEYWNTKVESGSDWGLRIYMNEAEYLEWYPTNTQNYQSENGSLDILKVGDTMVGSVEINDGVATTTLRKTISVLKLVLNLPDEASGDKLSSVQVQSQGGSITTGFLIQYDQMETPFMWKGGGQSALQLGLGSSFEKMDVPGNKQLVVYIPGALGQIPEGNLEIIVDGQNGNYVKTISIPEQKNMQAGFVYTITAALVKE
ncbi:MAG: hypothetical protein IKB48_04300 [Bacteroidales bacterium]|nr:hypothetical protein [Bacteroidales bacterium]